MAITLDDRSGITIGGVLLSTVKIEHLDGVTSNIQEQLDAIASTASALPVGGLTKDVVGLSNVDNTPDLLKPISTATLEQLVTKADISSTYSKAETDARIQQVAGLFLSSLEPSLAPVITPLPYAYEGTTATILISNYSMSTTYSVAVTSGTCNLNGNTITWHVPNVSVDTFATLSVGATEANKSQTITSANILVKNITMINDSQVVYSGNTLTEFDSNFNTMNDGYAIKKNLDSALTVTDNIVYSNSLCAVGSEITIDNSPFVIKTIDNGIITETSPTLPAFNKTAMITSGISISKPIVQDVNDADFKGISSLSSTRVLKNISSMFNRQDKLVTFSPINEGDIITVTDTNNNTQDMVALNVVQETIQKEDQFFKSSYTNKAPINSYNATGNCGFVAGNTDGYADDTYFYIFGGFNGTNYVNTTRRALIGTDLTYASNWTSTGTSPFFVAGAMFEENGYVYSIGHKTTATGVASATVIPTGDIYRAVKGSDLSLMESWSYVGVFPVAISGAKAYTDSSAIYIIGGSTCAIGGTALVASAKIYKILRNSDLTVTANWTTGNLPVAYSGYYMLEDAGYLHLLVGTTMLKCSVSVDISVALNWTYYSSLGKYGTGVGAGSYTITNNAGGFFFKDTEWATFIHPMTSYTGWTSRVKLGTNLASSVNWDNRNGHPTAGYFPSTMSVPTSSNICTSTFLLAYGCTFVDDSTVYFISGNLSSVMTNGVTTNSWTSNAAKTNLIKAPVPEIRYPNFKYTVDTSIVTNGTVPQVAFKPKKLISFIADTEEVSPDAFSSTITYPINGITNTNTNIYNISGNGAISSSTTTALGSVVNAFDNIATTGAFLSGTSGYLQFKGPYSTINKYSISAFTSTIANTNVNMAIKDWTLQASNDALTWVILDTQTNQTDWGSLEERTYYFNNIIPYTYYKLVASNNNGDTVATSIINFKLFAYEVPNDVNISTTYEDKAIAPTRNISTKIMLANKNESVTSISYTLQK